MAETSAMQSMGPARLMQLTEGCVTSFNADQLSLDAHADNFVQAQRVESADDETFLRQVLYGTMRYSKLLAAFCAAFYYKNRCREHSLMSCTLALICTASSTLCCLAVAPSCGEMSICTPSMLIWRHYASRSSRGVNSGATAGSRPVQVLAEHRP